MRGARALLVYTPGEALPTRYRPVPAFSHSIEPAAEPFGEPTLLEADEPPAFTQHGELGAIPVLVVCDHASRRIPRALGTLGLRTSSLERHIAWDIGAGDLSRRLADRLGTAAILAGYSRLVIDCNRRLEDPTSIAAHSDGEAVPGNLHLSAEERALRVRALFRPYQNAIAAALSRLAEGGRAPALIAVHSFTPALQGSAPRPWHCGILWNRDARIAAPLIEALRGEPGLVVGDNEPYSGRHPAGYTVDEHAERRGWPHVSLEIRQDLIADPAGIERWAERLGRALGPILADATLYRAEAPL